MPELSDAIERVVSESEIRRLLASYCRAVDRGDFDALRSCYHSDAIDDHSGVYSGGVDGFIETLQKSFDLGAVTCTRHCISNVVIEIDGDVAVAESYFDAYHRRTVGGVTTDESAAGRYLDRLERRNNSWRIAARRVVWDHMSSAPALPYPWETKPETFVVGARSQADESVRWFRERGPDQ